MASNKPDSSHMFFTLQERLSNKIRSPKKLYSNNINQNILLCLNYNEIMAGQSQEENPWETVKNLVRPIYIVINLLMRSTTVEVFRPVCCSCKDVLNVAQLLHT